jgi:hypothetical protein
MAELKIFHDREGQTLTLWFGVPPTKSSVRKWPTKLC